VLQALNQHNVLRNIDYLSTVSGGGYIGSALTAIPTATKGRFVRCRPVLPATGNLGYHDNDPVGHIRNYSIT
jgi:hypothetical protein